jgi:3-dehydroquinate synthase
MTQMHIDGASGHSTIVVGESIARLASYCDGATGMIVTDGPVVNLYRHTFPPWPVIEIGTGEKSKTLETVERLYEAVLAHEIDRSSLIVAIGGGIVCDVAGFAASTYLRGLSFGFVPTTLLAQVDAGVGGKNGVNFNGYKNLVGTFTQPSFVLCDPALLRTLPEAEVKNGFAEAIKQAAIGDEALFVYLEEQCHKALALDPAVVGHIVHTSLAIKRKIVLADEREQGERRKLNFGHTVGHALETVGLLRHGEAVSIGMVAAARLSVKSGLLREEDARRIEVLLRRFGLPVSTEMNADLVRHALRKDKKRHNDHIHFVLLDGIGSAKVVPVRIGELDGILDDLRESG